MKVQGFGLVHSFPKKKKNKKKLFDLGCKVVKIKVVLKDVVVRENDVKTRVVQEYSHACLRTKLRRRCL
jgi:hypothetical protein